MPEKEWITVNPGGSRRVIVTKDLPGVAETLKKVANIGYTAIQISGFGPVDPQDVAKLVEDNGLKVVSTHRSWAQFLNDLDTEIEIHKLWKCDHPAIGGLPREYHSLDGLKRFLDDWEKVKAQMAAKA